MATVTQSDKMRVFRTMRAKLLEQGLKCGKADDGAFRAVQLYKRCVKFGCPNPFDFVTSGKSVAHCVKVYGVK